MAAAAMPNPTNLSISTKLPPPRRDRTFSKSRSPSRSPTRKAQFAARELDPLLKNLSPDSTLEALQETNALGGNHTERNAIARSISDASEAERELGIRAAIAAKKLREWTEEVTAWPWPTSQDRVCGVGFVPPSTNEQGTLIYLGSLPEDVVKQREERLDEIWDAIDTLGMDEIKDYVFSSHHPTSRPAPHEPTLAYGRMRDFTALITATVIQALPALANLHTLLETWSVRLTVLRQIPDFLAALDQVKLGLATINDFVNDEKKSHKLTKKELETGKVMFGNKVSNLGKRVDNLLDLLEGQEDSLPQAWIDSLEDVEHKYAGWVAQAEKVVLRNQTAGDLGSTKTGTPDSSRVKILLPASADSLPNMLQKDEPPASSQPQQVLASPAHNATVIKRKPLEINTKAERGHTRGISEVSAADSVLSGYSLENAEIIDATATPVLPSPRINVVNSSSPNTKIGPSWMADKKTDQTPLLPRPGFIQRASTASIEFVPRERVREVMLRRSASYDMLSTWGSSSTTSQPAVNQSTAPSSTVASPSRELDNPILDESGMPRYLTPLAASPSPSLRVDPLSLKGKMIAESPTDPRPVVPRRSSKRLSMPLLNTPKRPLTPPQKPIAENLQSQPNTNTGPPFTPPSKTERAETFDDRLKSILASMPTKIRLTEGSDSGSSGLSSQSSSRASSPTRVLKLSPVKDGRSGQNGTSSSGIRVYHLKGGKSRDAPPVKLYVRAVGENGERVMVRVGGGWADLAEYLREYSLHHGGRALAQSKLEVAGFPGVHKTQNSGTSHALAMMPRDLKAKVAEQEFDFGLSEPAKPESTAEKEPTSNPWRPPPVPLLPHPMVPQARSTTPPAQSRIRGLTPTPQPRASSRISTTTATTPTVVATTTSSNSYTPLGAAGPVQNIRRATSNTFARTTSNEAWVEGMVNQARSVGGSHALRHHASHNPITAQGNSSNSTIAQTPTTVTTTMITSVSKPGSTPSRRFSSWSNLPSQIASNNTSVQPSALSSPQGSQRSNTSNSSSASYGTATTSKDNPKDDHHRRKSRMSLGDVGGIKRVFLRKKNDK